MKYSLLETIVENYAHELEEDAKYGGSWYDGGKAVVLNKLNIFKQSLVEKYDLRPSEYWQLNDKEVGEPTEFSKEIWDYRQKLAKNIKL